MQPRLYRVLMILIVVLMAVPASLVAAADPPEPTYVDLAPVVDGDYAEWDLSGDFFAYMYEAARTNHPILSLLYLRYDCGTGILYALVLVNPDPIFNPPLTLDITNLQAQMIKLEPNKLVDGTALYNPPDGTPPDMAWIWNEDGTAVVGWEAAVYLGEGTYTNFNVHAQTWYNGISSTSAVENRAITLVLDCDPTAVDLASFTAEAAGPAIQLNWQTTTEVDNLGFNLYRAESAGGTRTPLNAALIPGQLPGSPVGGIYSFLDTTALRGVTYYYWLEDVDLGGATGLHGPVSAALKAYVKVLPGRPRPTLAPVRVVQQTY
jgi:hypothetical protein